MTFSVGSSIGWASPSLSQLQGENSPIGRSLTSSEISWVGSTFALGALFGTLMFGWLSEKIGRFFAIIVTTVPALVSSVSLDLILFSESAKIYQF